MATVPTPMTFTDDVLDASSANAGIKDPLTFLLNPPIAQLRQTVAQTLTTGVFAAVTFTTEDVDSAGGHSTSSNTSRYTAVYAGWYLFSGGVSFVANATGLRYARWAKNGTTLESAEHNTNATATGAHHLVARVLLVYLNVGDYVELQARQNSGGNLNTEVTSPTGSGMTVRWVSN